MLSQLEVGLSQQPHLADSQHADAERRRIYGMVETVDSQLHHICKDMKEVVEQMNAAADPNPDETNDVMTQLVLYFICVPCVV
jgi:hypothetical protein